MLKSKVIFKLYFFLPCLDIVIMRGRVLERDGRVLGQGGRELVLACMGQGGGRGGRVWGGSQGRPRPHTCKTKRTRRYTIKFLYCLSK